MKNFLSISISVERGGAAVSTRNYINALVTLGFDVRVYSITSFLSFLRLPIFLERYITYCLIKLDQIFLNLFEIKSHPPKLTKSFGSSSCLSLLSLFPFGKSRYKIIHNIQPCILSPFDINSFDRAILVHHDGFWSNVFSHYTPPLVSTCGGYKFVEFCSALTDAKTTIVTNSINIFPSKWLHDYTLSKIGVRSLECSHILPNHAPISSNYAVFINQGHGKSMSPILLQRKEKMQRMREKILWRKKKLKAKQREESLAISRFIVKHIVKRALKQVKKQAKLAKKMEQLNRD